MNLSARAQLPVSQFRWLKLLAVIGCGGLALFALAPGAQKKGWHDVPWHGELMRDVAVLRDLDVSLRDDPASDLRVRTSHPNRRKSHFPFQHLLQSLV